MTRPLHARWATDTNYTNAPAAGTPTKVAPAAGEAAEGWRPTQRPAAQKLNDWMNRVGAWLARFDAAQLQNWTRVATLATFAPDPRGLAFAPSVVPTPAGVGNPWVLVDGSAGVVRHSPTGFGFANDIEEWDTAATPPVLTAAARCVRVNVGVGGDYFLAFSAVGECARSANGDVWNTITVDAEAQPIYDAASDGATIAVMLCLNVTQDVDVFSSPDLVNWTKRDLGLVVALTGVCWNGSRFIAVGNGKAATSLNGTSWTVQADPPVSLYGIRARPDTGVALAYEIDGESLYRTTDGVSWTQIDAPNMGATVPGQYVGGLEYADGVWVIARAMASDSETPGVPAWWSDDDGDTWHPIRVPRNVKSIAYGQGRWLLVCDNGTDSYIYSSLAME